MPGLRELRDGMESLRSVVSCSRVTENISSEMVSCIQEVLNTQKLCSFLLLDTMLGPKPSGERKRSAHLYLLLQGAYLKKGDRAPGRGLYAFGQRDQCGLSSSLSEPRRTQPLVLFPNRSFKTNLPSTLSSESSRRKTVCVVIVEFKQF